MKNIILLLILCSLFYSCADVQPQITECLSGHQYGFWSGLWHGMVAPLAFIGSLIWDDVALYATNNNGGWYDFGFVLGAGLLFGGGIWGSRK